LIVKSLETAEELVITIEKHRKKKEWWATHNKYIVLDWKVICHVLISHRIYAILLTYMLVLLHIYTIDDWLSKMQNEHLMIQ